jgi:hypothetical protein
MKKFLSNNEEWRVAKVFTNNNGLTIWTKVPQIVVYTAIY